jgi:CheY-like chemotaxis protein
VTKLNWDRLTVMVVDDNAFVRQLLESTIKDFGIRNIVGENDGATAIERLKLSKIDPAEAGIGAIDIIVSDYVMPAVDGMLFLRWLRTDDKVPDRFAPFVMISGAADKEVVERARDCGVTEFLAKPFSAGTVADRLLHVINQPRQFVLAPGYFGPDRRRLDRPVEQERRSRDKSDIQVVRGPSNEKTLRENVRAVHFQLSNRVRDKLGAYKLKGVVEFDPALVEAAQARILTMVGDYSTWVERYIAEMSEANAALESGEGPTAKHVARINSITHELRGQGGIFDYPLTTDLGKSLYRATEDPGAVVTQNKVKLIGAHIDAIRTVFKNKIKGDGGEVGLALLREIETAVQRYR